MLRALVIALALLAGAKIWAQERLFREGAGEALLAAYRERAMAACQSEQPVTRVAANTPLWTRPASVDLVIGRANADVHIWQFNSDLWPARFRHPHVLLTLGGGDPPPTCAYDVIEGRAYVAPL